MVDVCPKAIPTTAKQGVRAFIDGWGWGRRGEGVGTGREATRRNSTVSSDSHLETGHLTSIILFEGH